MMNLSAITKKYIGQPFKNYGCIELVVAVMAEMGHPLPADVDNITAGNYHKILEELGVRQAQFKMLRAFRQIGKPGSTKYPEIGDLLICMQSGASLFPAVAVGCGMGLASFIRTGVNIFLLDKYNRPIMARRVG